MRKKQIQNEKTLQEDVNSLKGRRLQVELLRWLLAKER